MPIQWFRIQDAARLVMFGTGTVNVKTYGATGDGVTDDTSAIQRALDAGAGKTVFFPRGTYIVAPSLSATQLSVSSGTTVAGDGVGTVIKVKDNAGDYGTIFGQASAATQVTDITFRDFRIDQNPAGNLTADIRTADATKTQYAIAFSKFDDVHVERVTFDSATGINTVVLTGGVASSANGSVRHCSFRFVQGRTLDPSGTYDNSAVYFNCRGHDASGNQFQAELTEDARGCIETHSGPSAIVGNRSKGYQTLVNIVSQSAGDAPALTPNAITVTGNTAENAGIGIRLWAITGTTLGGVVISGNTLGINNATRATDPTSGIGIAYSVSGDLDGAITGLEITGNVVRMEAEERTGLSGSTAGLLIYSGGTVSNVVIRGNVVINAPSQGLRLHSTATGGITALDVTGNMFTDCGNDSLATIRGAIVTAGVVVGRIAGNFIVDTGNPLNGAYSILDTSGAGSTLLIRDNRVSAALAMSYSASAYASEDDYVSLSPPSGGGGSLDTNAGRWRRFIHSVSHGDGYTLTEPYNGTRGARILIRQKNNSLGALGTTTWNAAFHLAGAWVEPATGKSRYIEFLYDGTAWYETWRSAADVAN